MTDLNPLLQAIDRQTRTLEWMEFARLYELLQVQPMRAGGSGELLLQRRMQELERKLTIAMVR